METRFVARCGFCNKGIRRVYRSEVVLEDHKWYCTYACRNKHAAGYTHESKRSQVLSAIGIIVTLLVFWYIVETVTQKARGHPATAEHADWFMSQTNQNGMSCCDMSDGHTLTDAEWRIVGASYEVRINGEWVKILPHQLAKGSTNPKGGAAVWYVMQNGKPHIYCFSSGVLS